MKTKTSNIMATCAAFSFCIIFFIFILIFSQYFLSRFLDVVNFFSLLISFFLAIMILFYIFTVNSKETLNIGKLQPGEKYSIYSSFRDEEYNWFLVMTNNSEEEPHGLGIYQISKENFGCLAKKKRKDGYDNVVWHGEIFVAIKEKDEIILQPLCVPTA